MDLLPAMLLAGQNLVGSLNRDCGSLPYWCLNVSADYRAEFEFRGCEHNIGRWWDAMLRLEEATGEPLPADVEAAMLENLHRSFDNPDGFCLPFLDWGEAEPEPALHSLREGLAALAALARCRHSRWAVRQGHRLLETVARAASENGTWDLTQIDYYARRGRQDPVLPPTNTHGRLIEALVWFYQAAGDALALELADRFARHHLRVSTQPDGRLNPAGAPSHTHSYLGTLRGLLLFGQVSEQREYVEAVAATYRVTLRRSIRESGFIAHDLGTDGRGDPASAGDIAQLALWLALAGYPEFLDDAERIVRSRLLPSQVTHSPGLRPATDDGQDRHARLDERILGAFGGIHRWPHGGKRPTTDVTAAVLHTLADLYCHIAVPSLAGRRILFHFDCQDGQVQVTCRRSLQDAEATLTVVPRVPEELLVRVPAWAPADSVRFTVGGLLAVPLRLGNFAWLPRTAGPVVLQYALPRRVSIETIAGVDYHLAWYGDEITGAAPREEPLPFYPPLE